jgi:hypothetical protein
MTAVRFECHGPTYAVTFSFDSRVVELIKATIPSCARSLEPGFNRLRSTTTRPARGCPACSVANALPRATGQEVKPRLPIYPREDDQS